MRMRLFGPIHKGLRHLLNTRVLQLGQMDLQVVADVRAQRKEVEKSFEVLHVHAAAEEEFVFPNIERKNQELFDRLNQDHQAFTSIMDSLEQQLEALIVIESHDERIMKGTEVAQAFNDFVVKYGEHMQVEEKTAMSILWEVLEDNQIMEIIGKMSMKPAPEISQYFLPFLVQATNPMERIGILSGMKSLMPANVFQGAIQIVQNALAKKDWDALHQALE
ncbi:MAG: hemerythrin domain-containing protein [Candidatus Thorarchaeota archaeon]